MSAERERTARPDPQPDLPQPDWDLSAYFEDLDAEDYAAFKGALARDILALDDRLSAAGALGSDTLEAWTTLLVDLEDLVARAAFLGSYLGCRSAAEARHEGVQAETAAHGVTGAGIQKLMVRVRAGLGGASAADFERMVGDSRLADVAYYLTRLRTRARWSMDEPLEALAADLGTTGISAFGRLYDQVSGHLEFDLDPPDQPQRRVPVAQTRTLLEDPDPALRRAAFIGANQAWESRAEVCAACLNAIAGTRLTLYARRGIAHFLDPPLFDSAISRETLETLMGVVEARAELPRAYLRRKAERLGLERLGFQDLLAPLPSAGSNEGRIPFDAARRTIVESFGNANSELAGLAERAFEGRWIDHAPRAGKRPGGFCSSPALLRESRIFVTYNGARGDVSTLAHELGHAFHGWVMRDQRSWARRYPMTLAETASTFGEQVVIDALLQGPTATDASRTGILDGSLQDAAAYLLNIPMRFAFERAFYEERAQGEVPVTRLKELMADAQRTWYGDALDPEQLDPWFWASKLHFYITELSFYNFPYTFGYLLSRGLYARFREEGSSFFPRYVEFLRGTGSDTAEGIAQTALGIDLTKPDFWQASIDEIERDFARYDPSYEPGAEA